jgi:NADP-dependent 3-hydroxy acid dehydrogenase YdfG
MSTQKPCVWFITGSSTGLGRKLAEAVLAKGDRVVATARKEATVADLEQQYPNYASLTSLLRADFPLVRLIYPASILPAHYVPTV